MWLDPTNTTKIRIKIIKIKLVVGKPKEKVLAMSAGNRTYNYNRERAYEEEGISKQIPASRVDLCFMVCENGKCYQGKRLVHEGQDSRRVVILQVETQVMLGTQLGT